MKKFLLLFIFLPSLVFAYPAVSPDLAEALKMLYNYPQAKSLLEKVEQEGPISIYSAPFQSNSNAMWMPDERAIVVNSLRQRSRGQEVRLILFELHNAIASKEFDHLDQLASWNKITKNDYIWSVEYLEHQNALNTKILVENAIAAGIFPKDSRWHIPSSFQEHLHTQSQSGHSAAIGALYEELKAYAYFPSKTR